MSILKAEHISIQFGGLKAVEDFDIEVNQNELVGLIGPNGAGKTTVFNMLTGVYKPTEGSIELNNVPIHHRKPNEIVLLGSCRTFQNIRLFKKMTVIDNILVAYHHHMKYNFIDSVLKTKKFYSEEHRARQKALELLDVFGMRSYQNELAMNLPYGIQRKLEIARALATQPKILLLDEPAAGMNPTETEELMKTIQMIKKTFNISILLIEHDMKLVMGICERIVVLDYGKIIAQGLPEDIKRNPNVIKAYLGG